MYKKTISCLLSAVIINVFFSFQCLAAGLNILLTNDDGWDSLGIQSVKTALESNGHNVTLVAPAVNKSGSGAGVTVAAVSVVQYSANEYAVDGSPATCVYIGMAIMDETPDLLVSGANLGFNGGPKIIHSGTIGAATTGIANSIPSLALSSELLNPDDPADVNNALHYQRVAEFLVSLITAMQEDKHKRLLPDGTGLIVGYPPVPLDADPAGIAVVKQGSGSLFNIEYTLVTPGIYAPTVIPTDPSEYDDAIQKFVDGKITIVPIDGDINASQDKSAHIHNIIKKLL